MKKCFLIIGLVLLFVFSSFINISLGYNIEIQDNFEQPLINMVTKEYLPHEPIYIDGNIGFIVGLNGIVSGSGTSEDPYLIKGWEINASNDIGIVIKNSDVYFTVDECFIHNGMLNQKIGVGFLNVSNGKLNNTILTENYCGVQFVNNSKNITISNCSIFYNNGSEIFSGCGIFSDSYMINIIDNNINYNLGGGIILISIPSMNSYNFIKGNIISNNKDAGIFLHGINYSTFINNIISDNFFGLQISSSNYNKIIDNDIINCNTGVDISWFSRNNTIQGNNITSSIYGGINLIDSSFNNVLGNILENNYLGINLSDCGQNNINGNNIKNSSYRGLVIHSCYENSIFKNNFIKNKRHAEFIGAYQKSFWDGNYWDNWIGLSINLFQKFPKLIFGHTLNLPIINFDWHPAKEPYEIPTESVMENDR